MVSDVLRRLVAHTSAQQNTKKAETVTTPFQYALSTRAGCECVSHALQTLTDLDERQPFFQLMGSEHSISFREEQCLKDS